MWAWRSEYKLLCDATRINLILHHITYICCKKVITTLKSYKNIYYPYAYLTSFTFYRVPSKIILVIQLNTYTPDINHTCNLTQQSTTFYPNYTNYLIHTTCLNVPWQHLWIQHQTKSLTDTLNTILNTRLLVHKDYSAQQCNTFYIHVGVHLF